MVTSLCSLSPELITEVFRHVKNPLSQCRRLEAFSNFSKHESCAVQSMPCCADSCNPPSTRRGATTFGSDMAFRIPPRSPFPRSLRAIRLPQLVRNVSLMMTTGSPSRRGGSYHECRDFLDEVESYAKSLHPRNLARLQPWGAAHTATLVSRNLRDVGVSWNTLMSQIYRIAPALRYLCLTIQRLSCDSKGVDISPTFSYLRWIRVQGDYFCRAEGIANLKTLMASLREMQTLSVNGHGHGYSSVPLIDACENLVRIIKFTATVIDIQRVLLSKTWADKLHTLNVLHCNNYGHLTDLRMSNLTQMHIEGYLFDELPIGPLKRALPDKRNLPSLSSLALVWERYGIIISVATAAQTMEDLAAICKVRGINYNALQADDGYMTGRFPI